MNRYVDSIAGDARTLSFLLEIFGDERIALGSDYPFPLGEAVPGKIIESLKLRPAAQEKLYSKNALRWLGRPRRPRPSPS